MGIRVVVDRPDWWPWLRWLQRLVERIRPPIPRGAIVTLMVNGKTYLRVPAAPNIMIGSRRCALEIRDSDTFQVTLDNMVGLPITRGVKVLLDGYHLKPGAQMPGTLSNPEGA